MDEAGIDPELLLEQVVDPADLPSVAGAGIYAICLTDPDRLPLITAGKRGLLYVGMTEQGFDARNHFTHQHSGFSTFRRSIGAILKGKLGLTAIPRSGGASQTNVRNYRFTDDGEQALTRWMNANLRIAQMALPCDIASQEKQLISLLEPPLNLTGWSNPQAGLIKRMRAGCVDEAGRGRA